MCNTKTYFGVERKRKISVNATFSRVAGFRVSERLILYQCICQSHHFCRNLLIAMSNREVNGWAIQQRQGTQRSTMAANLLKRSEAHVQYSCPSCGSENTQRLSTVYMAGVSQFSAVTNGFGWAGGFAGGSGRTEGVSQTHLSLTTAPPTKRRYWRGVGLLALSPLFAALAAEVCRRIAGRLQLSLRFEDLATTWFFLIVIAAILLLTRTFLYNNRTWPRLLQLWNMSFHCSRCSRVFIPGLSP